MFTAVILVGSLAGSAAPAQCYGPSCFNGGFVQERRGPVVQLNIGRTRDRTTFNGGFRRPFVNGYGSYSNGYASGYATPLPPVYDGGWGGGWRDRGWGDFIDTPPLTIRPRIVIEPRIEVRRPRINLGGWGGGGGGWVGGGGFAPQRDTGFSYSSDGLGGSRLDFNRRNVPLAQAWCPRGG